MNEAPDPLAALRPLHLPEPVSWWPPAPGWWVLALLGLVTAGATVWWWLRGRARRAALSELRRIETSGLPAARMAREVSSLLKRYALTFRPRTEVAGLTGEAWARYLEQGVEGDALAARSAESLIEVPYRREPDLDRASLLAFARRWIRRNGPRAGFRGRRA